MYNELECKVPVCEEFARQRDNQLNTHAAQIRKQVKHDFFRILFLPPGGVRGNATLRRLRRFEELSGQPIHKSFDFIVSASAGTPLAIALTVPDANGKIRSCREIEPLYEATTRSLLRVDFKAAVREGCLLFSGHNARKEFETLWPYQKLGGAHTHLMVSTHNALPMYRNEKYFYPLVNEQCAGFVDASDVKVSDVSRAAIAIPFAFPPVSILEKSLRDGVTNEIGALPFQKAIEYARKKKAVNQPIYCVVMTAGFDFSIGDRWKNGPNLQKAVQDFHTMRDKGLIQGEIFDDLLRDMDPKISESDIDTSPGHIKNLRRVEDRLFEFRAARHKSVANLVVA